jgi:hypothetical protein
MSAGNHAFGSREIMEIKAAANYLGVSRSHLCTFSPERSPAFQPFRMSAPAAAR